MTFTEPLSSYRKYIAHGWIILCFSIVYLIFQIVIGISIEQINT